jgi:S-DNA-T family DNA segregation ATPase FtsK/SpoIIIE
MQTKFFHYQLFLFFFLAVINLIYFGNHLTLPDHALSISSATEELGLLSYFFSSFISYVSYYSGSWVISFFFLSLMFYSYGLFKKIPFSKMIGTQSCLGVLNLVTNALFFPAMMGDGLFVIMEENIPQGYLWIFFSVSLVSTIYFIAPQILLFTISQLKKLIYGLRQTNYIQLLESLKKEMEKLKNPELRKNLGLNLQAELKRMCSNAFAYLKTTKSPEVLADVGILTKRSPALETQKKKAHLERQTVEDMESQSPNQPDFAEDEGYLERVNEDEVVYELDETDIEEPEFSQGDSQEGSILKYEKNKMTFFEAQELIHCVSTNHRDKKSDPDEEYFEQISAIIEDKLKEFGIQSHVVNVMKGPVVDTFELNLGPGVKVSTVSNRSDDVSLALSGVPLRIVYPMKGKTTVGVEVPRNPRHFIYLDEVLKTPEFKDNQAALPIAMGKNAYGAPMVVDLARMPHMLVAGTTGSGKSVFINTLLVSLIVKNSPERMKLILIDPKSVELALFKSLPHLIMPTLTDPSSSTVALLWAVEEMERRYKLLQELGVRNIDGYNKKIESQEPEVLAKVKPFFEDEEDEQLSLPYLVVVVDEVADLMQSKHGKEIETNVSRLAAKARAAGIHLVLATQRPSTDVITGVIKANFPTRIAFKVITNMDSRVILDSQGAEKLLGKGDMLFKDGVDLTRVHGAYVDEQEIEKLVEKLSILPTQFSHSALEFMQNLKGNTNTEGESGFSSEEQVEDELYQEAVDIVAKTRQASASWLQRRMNVGYNRAAKLIEAMEQRGIVGPSNGSKARQILVALPQEP